MPKWASIVLALTLASAAPLEAAEVGSTELVRQCKYPRQGKKNDRRERRCLAMPELYRRICRRCFDRRWAAAVLHSDRNDVGPGGGRLSGLGRQARRHVDATEIRHLAARVRRGVSLPEIGG
jgi:hypothetical protein